MDSVAKIFDIPEGTQYRATVAAASIEADLVPLSGEDYDLAFTLPNIPSGQTLILSYELEALPVSYGNMIVDYLE